MSSDAAQEFRASQSKTRHGLFIGAMLAVFGFWALFLAGESIPNRYWLGGLNLALGLAISLYAWAAGRNPGAALRIDDGGVWFRDWGLAVPWPAIDDVYQTGTRLQPFVTIRVADPGRFVASLEEKKARRLRGNRRRDGGSAVAALEPDRFHESVADRLILFPVNLPCAGRRCSVRVEPGPYCSTRSV
jgi:hypothetical protein